VFHLTSLLLAKDYQPRTNTVQNEKGDLVTNPHSIVARWRNHFSQLVNIHGVNDVRQKAIHTAEPLVPGLGASEVDMAIEKLNRQKSPGTDQIPAEFIKARVEQLTLRSINLLILLGIRKNCLRTGSS
jgi:hypothetical protein